MQREMNSVLMTSAADFLGQGLSGELLSTGCTVRALVGAPQKAEPLEPIGCRNRGGPSRFRNPYCSPGRGYSNSLLRGGEMVQGFHQSSFSRTQQLVDLRPGLLDGIEVGRVGRQLEQLRAASLDQLSHSGHHVRRQVVHRYHLSGLQPRPKTRSM
jgi:hypothetical protein